MNKNEVVAKVDYTLEGGDATLKLKHLDINDVRFILTVCAKLELLKKVKLPRYQSMAIKTELESFGVKTEYLKDSKPKKNSEDINQRSGLHKVV